MAALLKRLGLTQWEFSKKFGIGMSTIYRWRVKGIPPNRLAMLKELARGQGAA